MRTIHVRAFCSVKGGVGKSTLAVVEAATLASDGFKPMLLDCDLCGTSLAEGLELRAPVVALLGDGQVDLLAPPTGELLSREQTLRARDRRTVARGRVVPPPFINDVIGYVSDDLDHDCRLDALVWHSEPDDGVLYLPASSTPNDVAQALGYLQGPYQEQWKRRFCWILASAAEQLPHVTHIVIDLPPGLFGFANEVLSVLAHLQLQIPLPEGYPSFLGDDVSWTASAALVTSDDRDALVATLEQYVVLMDQLPTLVPVVNRATETSAKTAERVRRRFSGTGLSGMMLEKRLRWVGRHPSLERLFKEGRVELDTAVTAEIGALSPGRTR